MERSTAQRLQAGHQKIVSVVDRLLQLILAYALLVTVLIVLWQIVSRNFSIKNTWTEEASRWLFVWTCFIGASYFGFKNDHIIVDLVQEIRVLKLGAQKCEIVFKLLTLAFYILIAVGGVRYVMNYGGKISGGLRLPFRVLYYSCPVSFALMSVFTTYDLIYMIALKIAERAERRDRECF